MKQHISRYIRIIYIVIITSYLVGCNRESTKEIDVSEDSAQSSNVVHNSIIVIRDENETYNNNNNDEISNLKV